MFLLSFATFMTIYVTWTCFSEWSVKLKVASYELIEVEEFIEYWQNCGNFSSQLCMRSCRFNYFCHCIQFMAWLKSGVCYLQFVTWILSGWIFNFPMTLLKDVRAFWRFSVIQDGMQNWVSQNLSSNCHLLLASEELSLLFFYTVRNACLK